MEKKKYRYPLVTAFCPLCRQLREARVYYRISLCGPCSRAVSHTTSESYNRYLTNRNTKEVKVNGCILIEAPHGRPKQCFKCPDKKYDQCLTAVWNTYWEGWAIAGHYVGDEEYRLPKPKIRNIKRIGKKLKQILKERNIPVTKFSKRIGSSEQAIYNWYSGKKPSEHYFNKICDNLKIKPEELYGE